MKQSYKVYNDFSKGLYSDFNGVNQDPNTVVEIDNFIINNNGTISKRKGLGKESTVETGIVLPEALKNKCVTTYVWKNVGKSRVDLLVVQVGEKLYFYENSNNVAAGKIASEINILDYLTSDRLLLKDLRLTFTEIKGVLLCSHPQLTPFYLSYSGGSVSDNKVDLKIRDYYGMEEGNIELTTRPTTLSMAHLYNLYNQGWDSWMVYACMANNGFYPANSDTPNHYYNSSLEERSTGIRKFLNAYVDKDIKRFTKDSDEFAKIVEVGNKALASYTDKPGESLLGFNDNDVGGFYLQLDKAYGAPLIDFKKMQEKRSEYEIPKGRVIKDVFDPADVGSIVSRPIITAPDEDINRNKWNDFHIVNNVLDVFYDSGNDRFKLVVELDKEHGMYGGKRMSTNAIINAKLGHYNELNQKSITEGRIYDYELPEVLKDITQKKSMKTYKIDEGLWYSDGSGSSDFMVKFKATYNSDTEFLKKFSYPENKELFYLVQNLTNDPHKYKAVHYDSRSFTGAGLQHTRKSMNEEHLRAINFESKFKNNNASAYPLHRASIELSTRLTTFVTGYGSVSKRYNTNNSDGVASVPCYDSYNMTTYNGTQFDFQQVKRKNVSAQRIGDAVLKDAACYIEALSSKKCVITIPASAFTSKPSGWGFNASEIGELLCFDDIYNTMKIKLSQTLYDKEKKVYENLKRDEYASKKLDEEYKDNSDFFSVKAVNSLQSMETNVSRNAPTDEEYYYAYQWRQHFSIVLELDKPHNKPLFSKNESGYIKEVNLIHGDYTRYENQESFGSARLYIPMTYRMADKDYSTNTTSATWGQFYSDYARHLSVGQVMKLKPRSEWPGRIGELLFARSFNQGYLSPPFAKSDTNVQSYFIENKATNIDLNSFYGYNNTATYRAYSGYKINMKVGCDTNLYIVIPENASTEAELVKQGFLKGRDKYGSTAAYNLSTTGRPEVLKSYFIPSYAADCNRYGQKYYSTAENNTTSYDFLECYIHPMDLNMDKVKRKCLKEKYDVQFIGTKHICLTVCPTDSLVYTDADELVTGEDTDKEMPFITERNGNTINLHEFLNMKFSLDNTISRSEILAKHRKYRNEWTWDMDGIDENGDAPQKDAPAIDPDNLQFEDVREEFRPNCSAAYSGRAFFGGINSDKYSNTIFYSRIITQDIDNEISKCYTENDPTSKYLNSTIATDGGYINISGAGEILGLEVVGSVLCVVASNGVWAIAGPGGYFKATDHAVKKISNLGCISANSIKVVNDSLVYISEYSINILQLNNLSSDLIPNDMTKNRINKLYNDIPLSSKKYLKTIYDKVKGIVYFLYNSGETKGADPDYDSVLIYNIIKDSYFKFSFGSSDYKIKDAFINNYNHEEDIRLKFICMNDTDIRFFELNKDDFLDYDNSEYTAKIKSSSQIQESPINILAGGQIITHLKNNPNTSCLSKVNYDFGNPYKSTKPTEIYKDKPNNEIIFNKVMLRGEGNNINIEYESPKGKDCEILGFEVHYKVIVK